MIACAIFVFHLLHNSLRSILTMLICPWFSYYFLNNKQSFHKAILFHLDIYLYLK